MIPIMVPLGLFSSAVKEFSDVHRTNQEKLRSFYKRVLEHGVILSPSPYEANFI